MILLFIGLINFSAVVALLCSKPETKIVENYERTNTKAKGRSK